MQGRNVRRSIIIGLTGIGLLIAAGLITRAVREPQGAEQWRTASLDRGPISESVRATGTLNPVTTVLVGSQLSGQIIDVLADYNTPVKAGQIVAKLNPEQIIARRDAARAELAQTKAELAVRKAQADRARATRKRSDSALADQIAQGERTGAQLAENRRALDRQQELASRGISAQAALDNARTQVEMQTAAKASSSAQIASARAELLGLDADIALADAQVMAAEAAILGKEAKLKDIEIDLERTDIRSPVDGVVVQRQVELGQTVAASLSSPTLFLVAQDLREIEIYANIDEADVGRLKDGQTVTFTVNAYPARTFTGKVRLVRLGAQTIQNVVTYTAIVTVANLDMALKPGMTANLAILTSERRDVLRVPNAALRFRPPVPGGAPPALPSATAPVPLPNAPMTAAARGGERQQGAGQRDPGRASAELRDRMVADLKLTSAEITAIDTVFTETRNSNRGRMQGLEADERRAAGRDMRRELLEQLATALPSDKRPDFRKLVAEIAQANQANAQQRGEGGVPGRVFIVDENSKPKAVEVRLGISDGSVTEIISGDVKETSEVITGVSQRGDAAKGPATRGPRMF
jgi:HlyD family secretion protein